LVPFNAAYGYAAGFGIVSDATRLDFIGQPAGIGAKITFETSERTLGSVAFTAAPRAVWGVTPEAGENGDATGRNIFTRRAA
jgi:hypothetical protein